MITVQKILTSDKNGNFTNVSKVGKRIINNKLRPFNVSKTDSFRDHEYFQEFIDKDYQIPSYDYNDLPLSENLRPLLRKLQNRLSIKNIDSTPLESAKLIGTNRKVYLDSVYSNPTKVNNLLLEYVNEGYKFQDAANIFYRANGHYHKEYLDEAFALIDQQFPLKLVLEYMDKSLYNDGKNYHKGLMKFISQNPDKIDKVLKKHIGCEYFDNVLAKNYHALECLCKSEYDVDNVIKSCSCLGKQGESMTHPNLLDFALEILTKQNSWDDSKIKLFEIIKGNQRNRNSKLDLEIDSDKLYTARNMFRNSKSINDIILKLTSE